MGAITFNQPGKSVLRLLDSFLIRKKSDSIAKKNIHLVLKGESINRLNKLSDRFEPSTNTNAISVSLQLTEAMLKEYDQGTRFFALRKGDDEPIEMEVF